MPRVWQLKTRTLALSERPLLMGIVNVTPDSFSDGGAFFSAETAVAHALQLLDDGADLLDVGGESTRPGSLAATSESIHAAEEQRRVLPVIEAVVRARPDVVLSVDTYRASTARAAVEAGAEIVNDVSGMLWDDAMAATCAALACGVVVMHTRGRPSEWRALPAMAAADVAPLVARELEARVDAVARGGVHRDCIAIDPGFGFGKRGAENDALLAGLGQLRQIALPMVIGLSRKGFLGGNVAAERDAATHAAGIRAVQQGAQVLRVHDVRGAREVLREAGLL